MVKGAEEVEAIVNKIEELDSKIESLTQEKGKLTSEHYIELLEHDLGVIENITTILSSKIKTTMANNLIEEYDVEGNISEVISEIEKELIKAVKN